MTTFSLSELEDKYKGSRIPYEELLRTPEWVNFRLPIIERDGHMCTNCSTPATARAWGKNVYWLKKSSDRVIREEFWKKWEDSQRMPGNENEMLHPSDEDYISVPKYEYETLITVQAPVRLHVHHTYYVEGVMPWDYPPEWLLTLCNWCHAELHAKEKVPYYRRENSKLIELDLTACARCNGAGFLPQYHYVVDGICFVVKGTSTMN